MVKHCQNGTRTALIICLWNIAFMLPTVSVQVVFINLSARDSVGHKFKRDCCPTLCRSEGLNESLSLCTHKHSIMQALAKTFTQALLLTTRALLMLISQISSPLHTFRRYLLIRQECCHSFSHFLAVRGEWLGDRLSGTVHDGAAFDGDRWFFLWDSLSLL